MQSGLPSASFGKIQTKEPSTDDTDIKYGFFTCFYIVLLVTDLIFSPFGVVLPYQYMRLLFYCYCLQAKERAFYLYNIVLKFANFFYYRK